MAVLLLPMSAIPDLQHHMTAAHGHSVPSNLSHNPTNATNQSSNKRPKLSLQTASLTNTYSSLTRGLAPNTTQTIYTPTTTNTLANTWDLSIRPSPVSRTESPRPPQQLKASPGPAQQPYAYSLPFGLKPILKNSPLPPRAASVSASPRDSRRKVFFPQPKRVSFRAHLEDQIETKQYVARHSDLTSSEEEASDDEPQGESSNLKENDTDTTTNIASTYHTSPPPNRKRKVRRDSGIYLDTKAESSTAEATTSTPEDNTIIKPPPSCKRRKWQSNSFSFGGPIEKEGEALKRSPRSDADSENILSEQETKSEVSEQPSKSDDQPAKEGNEEEERRISSPLLAVRELPNLEDYAKPLPETGDEDVRSQEDEHGDGDGDGMPRQ